MKKTFITLAILAMTMLTMTACSGQSAKTDGVNNFTIKRGTNLSHWLSQPTTHSRQFAATGIALYVLSS